MSPKLTSLKGPSWISLLVGRKAEISGSRRDESYESAGRKHGRHGRTEQFTGTAVRDYKDSTIQIQNLKLAK